MEAGRGVYRHRLELDAADKHVILVAIDELDEVFFFHRMHGLSDTDENIEAGDFGNEAALFADGDGRDVLHLGLRTFRAGIFKNIIILIEFILGRAARRAFIRESVELDMAAYLTDVQFHNQHLLLFYLNTLYKLLINSVNCINILYAPGGS